MFESAVVADTASVGHMWGLGMGMTVIWLLAVAAIAVALATMSTPFGRSRGHDYSSAIGLLERRFAAGEIDEEEYQRRRRVLEDGRVEDA